MKQYAVRAAIAFLAFAIGLMSTTLVSAPRESEPPAPEKVSTKTAEDEILAAVFSYQIQTHSERPQTIFFLAVHNFGDPSQTVVRDLIAKRMFVTKFSEFSYWETNGPKLPWVFLRTGKIRWLSQDEVVLGASSRGWRDTEASVFQVVRDGSRWKVKSCESVLLD